MGRANQFTILIAVFIVLAALPGLGALVSTSPYRGKHLGSKGKGLTKKQLIACRQKDLAAKGNTIPKVAGGAGGHGPLNEYKPEETSEPETKDGGHDEWIDDELEETSGQDPEETPVGGDGDYDEWFDYEPEETSEQDSEETPVGEYGDHDEWFDDEPEETSEQDPEETLSDLKGFGKGRKNDAKKEMSHNEWLDLYDAKKDSSDDNLWAFERAERLTRPTRNEHWKAPSGKTGKLLNAAHKVEFSNDVEHGTP